jgi:hypothetical protein
MTITGPSGISISETTTVGEIASGLPAAVRVWQHALRAATGSAPPGSRIPCA